MLNHWKGSITPVFVLSVYIYNTIHKIIYICEVLCVVLSVSTYSTCVYMSVYIYIYFCLCSCLSRCAQVLIADFGTPCLPFAVPASCRIYSHVAFFEVDVRKASATFLSVLCFV